MNRLSLMGRLMILTLIALVPALVVLTVNIFSARSDAHANVHNQALNSGHLASVEMNRIISSIKSMLDVLGEVPAVRRVENAADCNAFLLSIDSKLDMIANFTVLGTAGELKCSSNTAPATSFADRSYFHEALTSRQFVVGGYVIDRITGRPALPLALPLVEAGEVKQIIVALLDLGWLGQRVKERDFSQGNALTIADRDGIILAREPFPERFVGVRIPAPYLSLVHAPSPGTREVKSQDGTLRVIGYYPSPSGIYVSVGLSLAHELEEMQAATLNGIAVLVLAIIGPFVAVWLASQALIRRPAKVLVKTVTDWQKGDTTARTQMRGGSEFETAGAAIDQFLDQLSSSSEQHEKDEKLRQLLVRELDHRIKNLLATVQAVARQTFKSGRSIDQISETFFHRIQAMAGAHQLLTQNWQSASLNKTVATAIEPFNDSPERRFRIEGADVDINAATALAISMALHELCTNAAKYGALSVDTGKVEIRWQNSSTPEHPDSFLFSWRETGGPTVSEPQREGFGTLMIERVLSQQLAAVVSVEYIASGLVCTITAPLKAILPPADQSSGAVSARPAG